LGGTQAATTGYLTQAAQRGSVTQGSAATGTVASAATYSLAFGIEPRLSDTISTASSTQAWTVDEVLVSLDYPDERHDDFRAIPGLFGRIQALVAALPPRERQRVLLTTVLHAENFQEAVPIARLALSWGVNANFSAYTPLRTSDRNLLIPADDVAAFGETVEQLIAFKKEHGNVLTSDWVLRGMVKFFGNGGRLGRCRAGVKMAVVNPDGTLSPCGLLVRDYRTHAELKREFTAKNECNLCFTSTRGNSERPARYVFLDHLPYLRRRAEA